MPDSNVRLAWRRATTSARAAHRSALARLLLYIQEHAFQLDRKLLSLLFTASLSSACIIPVGPEFQDPSGEKNAPAIFAAVSPGQGTTVVADPPNFIVTPMDPNVGDQLFVLWLFEYPPFSPTNTHTDAPHPISPSKDGSAVRQPDTFPVGCGQLNRAISTHQITAAVSDSPFVGSFTEDEVLKTASGVRPTQVNWTWIKNCPGSSQ